MTNSRASKATTIDGAAPPAAAHLTPASDRVRQALTDLARTGSVPVLTPVATAALDIARRRDPDPLEMVDIIETDVGLAARILRLANSYAYLRRTPARTIREAVLTVGIQETCNLVVSASAQGLHRSAGPHAPLLWEHAVAVGIATREVVRMTRQMEPDVAFLPGLFHDIGRILFRAVHPVAAARVDALFSRGCTDDAIRLEHELFGFDHAEAGASLVEHWGLTSDQSTAIRWHHHPSPSSSGLGASIVAAETLVASIQTGTPATLALPATLGLPNDSIHTLTRRIRDRMEEQQALLGES